MPVNEAPRTVILPEPIGPREEAQLMLGQIHGVVSAAIEDAPTWLLKQPTEEGDTLGFTVEEFRRAGDEIHAKFGLVHAALDAIEDDQTLSDYGFGAAQAPVKRKGHWASVKTFFRQRLPEIKKSSYVRLLGKSLRWGEPIVGSIGAALEKEVKHGVERVPGGAAAVEMIKEFIGLLRNAVEPGEPGPPQAAKPGPKSPQ